MSAPRKEPVARWEAFTLVFPPADPVLLDLELEIASGEALGLVGVSGSGKTLAGRALLGAVPAAARPGGKVTLPAIGVPDLARVEPRRLQQLRGAEVAYLPQHPALALDPQQTARGGVERLLRTRDGMGGAAARRRAEELLQEVELGPEAFARRPHELSGGMAQRAALALALALDPSLLVADEPTTALDAMTAQRVLELLGRLRAQRGLALLLISHDLPMVARHADRLAVLHRGQLMEVGPTRVVVEGPAHPVTRALLGREEALDESGASAGGCRFLGRCPVAIGRCGEERPPLVARTSPEHRAACWEGEA